MSVDTSHILAFVSGITMVPSLGFQNPQLKMYFTDSVVATASTCDISVHIPRCHADYERFKEFMTESIISNNGYGMT